jgi:hypothetical protein
LIGWWRRITKADAVTNAVIASEGAVIASEAAVVASEAAVIASEAKQSPACGGAMHVVDCFTVLAMTAKTPERQSRSTDAGGE